MAELIASKSQVAAAFAKRAVNTAFEVGLSAGNDSERNMFIALMATHDKQEGVSAFLNKRKPKFLDQ